MKVGDQVKLKVWDKFYRVSSIREDSIIIDVGGRGFVYPRIAENFSWVVMPYRRLIRLEK